MLTRDEALEAAAPTLAREGEAIGQTLRVRGEIETPSWFVLVVDSEEGGASHRIPPVVVDRRDGTVRRPFSAHDDVLRELRNVLGADEWIVPRGVSSRARHPQPATNAPGQAAAERARLRRFRVAPARHRDDGDHLEAWIVGTSPAALVAGFAELGVVDRLWSIGERHVVVSIDDLHSTARIFVGHSEESPWTFDDAAVATALEIEAALDGADWIVD